MRKPCLDKIDFSKSHKDLYTATSRIKEVRAEKATFLSIEGQGAPGSPTFQSAIQQMFSVAYTTKFMLKNAGKLDYGVSRLECLWPDAGMDRKPKSEWRWQLLMRIPGSVTESHLKQAREEIRERHGLDTSPVKRVNRAEGRCLQVMHVGPYDEVGKAYKALDDSARSMGLATACPGHEIYISDPRRVAPAKLKTIIRLPVKKSG